jgi:hypothetical protein
VRVLSVDDWAWRKKQRYGTMLMDLERSQVIDLLPDRSADSFARWLGLHLEVEVITCDRSSLYADGGRQGAPSAVQITDRYHLVSNLTEAVERDIQQLQIDARKQLTQGEAQGPAAANNGCSETIASTVATPPPFPLVEPWVRQPAIALSSGKRGMKTWDCRLGRRAVRASSTPFTLQRVNGRDEVTSFSLSPENLILNKSLREPRLAVPKSLRSSIGG